jgi:hypothetical protein
MPIRHAIWKVGTKPEPPPFKKGSPHPGRALFIFRGRESKRSERQSVAATRPGMAASAREGETAERSPMSQAT